MSVSESECECACESESECECEYPMRGCSQLMCESSWLARKERDA